MDQEAQQHPHPNEAPIDDHWIVNGQLRYADPGLMARFVLLRATVDRKPDV